MRGLCLMTAYERDSNWNCKHFIKYRNMWKVLNSNWDIFQGIFNYFSKWLQNILKYQTPCGRWKTSQRRGKSILKFLFHAVLNPQNCSFLRMTILITIIKIPKQKNVKFAINIFAAHFLLHKKMIFILCIKTNSFVK
jgi:hypothetical protein